MLDAHTAEEQAITELLDVLEQLWHELMKGCSALLMILVALFTVASAVLSLALGGVRLVILATFVARIYVGRLQQWCMKQSHTPLAPSREA